MTTITAVPLTQQGDQPANQTRENWIRVAPVDELRAKGVIVVHGDRPIAVYVDGQAVHAVDNRCPHLGFPLNKGTIKDGLLTCHWHQARFDLCSGCTLDLWADDVPAYDTQIRQGVVYVAALPRQAADRNWYRARLEKGMRQAVTLLQAKALVGLLQTDAPASDILAQIADFATQHLNVATGVTELTIAGNLSDTVSRDTLYYLLLRAAQAISAPAMNSLRRTYEPLDGAHSFAQLNRWFAQWVEVRDRDGAERILVTAVRGGATISQLAEMIFGAISQCIYRQQGHVFDLANKLFELLDHMGAAKAGDVLPLVIPTLISGRGMEENGAYHHPIELVEPLRRNEAALQEILKQPRQAWFGAATLVEVLLGEDPLRIIDALTAALRDGAAPAELSKCVAYAAAMRLARFAKANEVGDWFNPQHTFTFANAVHHAVKRAPVASVVRAIYHAALSVYSDRFLNVPPNRLPGEGRDAASLDALPSDAAALRNGLLACLDERSNIDQAARIVSRYVRLRLPLDQLFDTLAFATVREDLDFHTLQVLEAGFQQCRQWGDQPQTEHILIGVVRDLAAFCPTRRAQLKTATTALKLNHGEKVYEENG